MAPPGANVQAGFVRYLQDKFSTVDRLNKIWGLVYWGQTLARLVRSTAARRHPESRMEAGVGPLSGFDRHSYFAWQAAIVREYLRPDQFVMQDFGGAARSGRQRIRYLEEPRHRGHEPVSSRRRIFTMAKAPVSAAISRARSKAPTTWSLRSTRRPSAGIRDRNFRRMTANCGRMST